jgi:hypothetical protein
MSTCRINDLLNLATVQHWHTVPTAHKPSVAEHSYRVAAIAMALAERLFTHAQVKYEVLRWALVHDGPETETGDLPHTAKKRLRPGVWFDLEKQLCPWYADEYPPAAAVRAVVKIADLMECWIFISQNGQGGEALAAEDAIWCELIAVVQRSMWEFNWPNLEVIVIEMTEHAGCASDTRHAPLGLIASPPPTKT